MEIYNKLKDLSDKLLFLSSTFSAAVLAGAPFNESNVEVFTEKVDELEAYFNNALINDCCDDYLKTLEKDERPN